MSVFHEVHCDAKNKAPSNPDGTNGCVSDAGDGPFGWTVADARQMAKVGGWVRRNGLDICPKCKGVTQ